jgi:hypothetical protein
MSETMFHTHTEPQTTAVKTSNSRILIFTRHRPMADKKIPLFGVPSLSVYLKTTLLVGATYPLCFEICILRRKYCYRPRTNSLTEHLPSTRHKISRWNCIKSYIVDSMLLGTKHHSVFESHVFDMRVEQVVESCSVMPLLKSEQSLEND